MDLLGVFLAALQAAVGVPAAAYAVAGVGLNVHFGYTGLLNFGHVGFMMVGAYGTAIAVDRGLPLPVGVLCGILAAAVLGLILGIPTLRLRADYLAIVTIAVAEILRLTFRSQTLEPYTRGVFGIQRFADSFYRVNPIPSGRYGWREFSFSQRQLWVIAVGWGLVALTSLLVKVMVNSPWGRVLKAIREDEDAARSLGKNVFGYKLQSLVLGGTIGSLAGVILAVDRQNVNPDSWVAVLTFFTYTVILLGGAGTVLGPIVGSIIFWFLIVFSEGLLKELFGSSLDDSQIAAVRFALVGAFLMVLMIFRPQGIFGDRAEMLIDDR